jgi:hypothetical protein
MTAPRNFTQLLADQLGVTEAQARAYIKQHGGLQPASQERDAVLLTDAALADLEGAQSIDQVDISDAASEPDPLGALHSTIDSRSERALRARLAAHTSWANTDDRAARTRRGREAFEARFERQVDPDVTLDPAARRRRADHARKAYFLRLSLKSAQARRKRPAQP